jgi:hypothetical protein
MMLVLNDLIIQWLYVYINKNHLILIFLYRNLFRMNVK